MINVRTKTAIVSVVTVVEVMVRNNPRRGKSIEKQSNEHTIY